MVYHKTYKIIVKRRKPFWNVEPLFLLLSLFVFWLFYQVFQSQNHSPVALIKNQFSKTRSKKITTRNSNFNVIRTGATDSLKGDAVHDLKIIPTRKDVLKDSSFERLAKEKNAVKIAEVRKIASLVEKQNEFSDLEQLNYDNQTEAENFANQMLEKEMADANEY